MKRHSQFHVGESGLLFKSPVVSGEETSRSLCADLWVREVMGYVATLYECSPAGNFSAHTRAHTHNPIHLRKSVKIPCNPERFSQPILPEWFSSASRTALGRQGSSSGLQVKLLLLFCSLVIFFKKNPPFKHCKNFSWIHWQRRVRWLIDYTLQGCSHRGTFRLHSQEQTH